LAGELMKNLVLLREIRDNEGAMDAGYFLNPNGTFSFYSYRDPHTL
jgi:Zn-dependent M16 (insulinase) family peptidase